MSDEENKRAMWQHYISCPRFGGQRVAINCVHLDRYRACRKWCPSLAAHRKKFPNLLELVKELCVDNVAKPSWIKAKAQFSGKGVPDPELVCPICRFVAKSMRGLKSHNTRQHPSRGLFK
jgi:hypothetical protein